MVIFFYLSFPFSQQQLKDYEQDYEIIIRRDFDEITYQIDKFLQNQDQSYKKVQKFLINQLRSQLSSSSSSSSEEDGELDSSPTSTLNSVKKKRIKSHH